MIAHIVGCRPNFVKLAAVWPKVGGEIFHTGQHWGEMSAPFFQEYALPSPRPISELSGNMAIVYGDTRSTLEGALLAKHKGMTVVHVESGLRCGDLTMEEELNRIAVDHMSDILFCTEQSAVDNLEREKVRGDVHLVGNVLMDTMPRRYGVLTLHRPFNVDDSEVMAAIRTACHDSELKFRYVGHPRWGGIPMTRKNFLFLLRGAVCVVTDSGGVQEEAAWLGIPCLTMRPNTERPITLQYGNKLTTLETLTADINALVPNIPLWDGRAAERIATILQRCMR